MCKVRAAAAAMKRMQTRSNGSKQLGSPRFFLSWEHITAVKEGISAWIARFGVFLFGRSNRDSQVFFIVVVVVFNLLEDKAFQGNSSIGYR